MKRTIPALLLISGILAPSAALAAKWAVYEDGEHGCRLEYASSLFGEPSVDDEDFQRFAGPDQHTYFRVKSLPNEKNWTAGQIREEYTKSRRAGDVVYARTKRDFLVLSGIRGKNIFYTKVALSPDNETICVLHMSYPRKSKRAFDAIVTRMSRSFTADD